MHKEIAPEAQKRKVRQKVLGWLVIILGLTLVIIATSHATFVDFGSSGPSPTTCNSYSGYEYYQDVRILKGSAAGEDYQVRMAVDSGNTTTPPTRWFGLENAFNTSPAGFVGYQGIAVSDGYVFLTDSCTSSHTKYHSTIRKYGKDSGTLLLTVTDYHTKSAIMTSSWWGFSDCCYHNGYLYVIAMEYWGASTYDSCVMKIDPSDLSLADEWRLANYQGGEGIDYHDGYWWTVQYEQEPNIVTRWAFDFGSSSTFAIAHQTNGKGEQTIVWDHEGDGIFVKQHAGKADYYQWQGNSSFVFQREVELEPVQNPGLGYDECVPLARDDEEMDVYWTSYYPRAYAYGGTGRIYKMMFKEHSVVYLNGHATDFPNDIAIELASDGTPVSHCLRENEGNATRVYFDLKIPANLTSNEVMVRIWYGKSGASSLSDGKRTYIAWDDFDTGYIVGDAPKADRGWVTGGLTGTNTATIQANPSGDGMVLRVVETGDGTCTYAQNSLALSWPIAIEYDLRVTTTYPVLIYDLEGGASRTTQYWYLGDLKHRTSGVYTEFYPARNYVVNTWYDMTSYLHIAGAFDLRHSGYRLGGGCDSALVSGISAWRPMSGKSAAQTIYVDSFVVRKLSYPLQPRVGESSGEMLTPEASSSPKPVGLDSGPIMLSIMLSFFKESKSHVLEKCYSETA